MSDALRRGGAAAALPPAGAPETAANACQLEAAPTFAVPLPEAAVGDAAGGGAAAAVAGAAAAAAMAAAADTGLEFAGRGLSLRVPAPGAAATTSPATAGSTVDDSAVPTGPAAPTSPHPAPSPRGGGSLDERAFHAIFESAAVSIAPAAGGATAAASAATAAAPARRPMSPKGRYVVFQLDSSDTAARLSSLLAVARKGGKALAALAAATGGQSVGVGVASAYGLGATLKLLRAAGLGPRDVDFLVSNCGSQIWYGAGSSGGGGGSSALVGRADESCCVADEPYDAFVDHHWDKASVRRVLAQLLAQPGLLTGLAGGSGGGGAAGGGAAAAGAVKISADTTTGAHHLLLTIRRAATGGGGGGGSALHPPPQALSAQELTSLVARIRKRFRGSGLRTQVVAQVEGDGTARIHITPLRASRALALRYLAHQHGVDLRSLVVVA
jgi:hypothetical protein